MPLSLQDLEDQGSLKSFDEVRQEVATRRDLRMQDRTVELKNVTITENLHVRVPGHGILEMTDWAKHQIGSALGVRWNKWFALNYRGEEGTIISPREIQEELSRRFNRLPGMSKLVRARRHVTSSARSDGLLEAFLSTTYEPIDDERVFDRLEKKLGDRMSQMRVLRHPLRRIGGPWNWGWGNDKTSHYTFLTGEERDLSTGDEPDIHLAGFHLRNSEVGAASLTMDDFWLRLICVNGILTLPNSERLLYRQHRQIEDDDIDNLLSTAMGKLEDRHGVVLDKLIESREMEVESPKEEIERFLTSKKQSNRLIERSKEAWEEEQIYSRFGVVQAITRVARRAEDPDRRMEIEQLAGRFLLVA